MGKRITCHIPIHSLLCISANLTKFGVSIKCKVYSKLKKTAKIIQYKYSIEKMLSV